MIKLIYLKSALKCDSFDVAIDIKIPFCRVLVTIEPGRSLLLFVTTNCLKNRVVLTSGLRGIGSGLIKKIFSIPFRVPFSGGSCSQIRAPKLTCPSLGGLICVTYLQI